MSMKVKQKQILHRVRRSPPRSTAAGSRCRTAKNHNPISISLEILVAMATNADARFAPTSTIIGFADADAIRPRLFGAPNVHLTR